MLAVCAVGWLCNILGEEFWYLGFMLPRQELTHGRLAWLVKARPIQVDPDKKREGARLSSDVNTLGRRTRRAVRRGVVVMEIEGTVRIERPIGEVWAVFMEAYPAAYQNDFAWQPDLLDETVLFRSPTGLGTKVRERRPGLGESTWEIIELIPMQRIVWKSVESRMPYEGVYSYEEEAGATRYTYWARVEMRGLQKLLAPFARRASRKQLDVNLQRLKRILDR